MSLPRLLLVPQLTQIEWTIEPDLEQWAEVASFDPPGVGNEPAPESYGCLRFTAEGFNDAASAFPHARTASTS